MSYIVYINGQEVEIDDSKPIAYTKQVNDIARLDNRQSNFTHKSLAKLTAKNKRVMDKAYLVGNNSNVPYQRNRVDIIDLDTGEHLVYNGVAIINLITGKGYEINTYDGLIDFFRAIENHVLTECNLVDLNHVKNLTSITDSWSNNLAYKYIIADYNGKGITSDAKLNADYLVPSAKYSYLWQKVHEFAGFTYSGNIFNTERFINWWMTYPKPVPTTDPNVIAISSQSNSIVSNGNPYYYDPLNIGSSMSYMPVYFPTPVIGIYVNNSASQNTFVVILSGSYRLTCEGSINTSSGDFKIVPWEVRNSLNQITSQGNIDASLNQSNIIQANAGDKIIIGGYLPLFGNVTGGSIISSLDLIDGYTAMFSDAFIDFQCKDFVNEVMQELGLTAFKDRFTNHIDYLTTDEILQGTDVEDWSSKFTGKISEKPLIQNYAQLNKYKYRYNNDNETYNDGKITINNVNLKDEVTILQSKIYSPEKETRPFFVGDSHVYKLWNKELKDNGTIDYKDLSGRFYSLRYEDSNIGAGYYLKSEILNTEVAITTAPYERYYRLSLQHIIYDNYSSIESILDKAKTLEANFNLKAKDVLNFTFKKLIYIDQLASFYMVNKIPNFVKGKETKCEIIEVDYFKELVVPPPTELTLILDNTSIDGCEITFDLTTNIAQPANVKIQPYILTLNGGVMDYTPYGNPIDAVMDGGQVIITTTLQEMLIGGYKFKIMYLNNAFEWLETNLSSIINVPGTCSASGSSLSFINITDIETISLVGNVRKIRVTYVSDLPSGTMPLTIQANIFIPTYQTRSDFNATAPPNGTIDIDVDNILFGQFIQWSIQLSSGSIISNVAFSS